MIELRNVTKIYKNGKEALSGLNLTINTGEICFIVGESGAGKSTLVKLLLMEEKATEGEILVDGRELTVARSQFRSSLGYLPQSTKLMPRLNIVEFLDYVCILKGIQDKTERRERIAAVIETVGLKGEEKKRLGRYSGGMLRRAGIAQVLIGDPKVLIIDEPTTGLDPEERLYFLNLLSRIAKGRIVIFSTHITSDIAHLCSNICVLEEGKVQYAGDKLEFVSRISGRTWTHRGTEAEEAMLREEATVTAVTYLDGDSCVRYVADGPLTKESEKAVPTLEDAYIYTLGGVKR